MSWNTGLPASSSAYDNKKGERERERERGE
jgi:hypothetical protein